MAYYIKDPSSPEGQNRFIRIDNSYNTSATDRDIIKEPAPEAAGSLTMATPGKRLSNTQKIRKNLLLALGGLFTVCIVSLASIGGYVLLIDSFPADTHTDPVIAANTGGQTYQNMSTGSGSLTVQQIAAKAVPSVVTVISQTYYGESTGSGIIKSGDGYIITNAHVVTGSQSVKVVLPGETENSAISAEIIGEDSQTDLAVIKINAGAKTLIPAEFGDSDKLSVGQTAVAIGNPLGLEFAGSVTSGVISALGREIEIDGRQMTMIQTDASINPGNSGGPLVNDAGQVIGINSVKISNSYAEGLGFAIPINNALPIIDELIENGYISGRPSIGISGEDIDETVSRYYNLPQGVAVALVDPTSGAARAGIQAGDIITAINGQEITGIAELNKIKNNFKAGDTVRLSIYRDGESTEVDVILQDAGKKNNSVQNNNGD